MSEKSVTKVIDTEKGEPKSANQKGKQTYNRSNFAAKKKVFEGECDALDGYVFDISNYKSVAQYD